MTGPNVVSGALLTCSFGVAPATLEVPPTARTMIEGRPAATVMDCIPLVNIKPFGMCTSLANPSVAAATAAAGGGTVVPQACTPVTQPWQPGAPRTTIAGPPALTATSTCACAFGGVVTISMPGSLRTLSG